MTKLFDPDSLNQATEVVITTGTKTIQLIATGNLSAASPAAVNGVTGQAVYSFLKEEWKTDDALNKFKFPLFMFTKTDGQLINGWTWADATTRELLRDFGYTEGANQHAGLVSLGDVDADTDQAYYTQGALYNDTVTDFTYTGELNETVDITGNTAYIKAFLRIEGKTFAEYDLVKEQNLSLLEPVLYKFPFANANDINNTDNDTYIGANTPYTGMSINYLAGELFETAAVQSYALDDVVQDTAGRWGFCTTAGTMDAAGVAAFGSNGGTAVFEAYDGEYTLDGGTNYYAANRIIVGNNATAAEIYDWMQYQVRQVGDINANDSTTVGQRSGLTMNGTNAELLGFFVGSNLHTYGGVYVSGVNSNSINDLTYGDITVDGGGLDAVTHVPVTTTDRVSPFTAAGTFEFSSNLVAEDDVDTRYVVYFDNAGGSLFDSSAAVIVDDNGGTDMDGQITAASIGWDFDYTNNAQGGRTPDTDAAVSIVATGLDGAQWVLTTYTITKTTGQTINVNANDERNYSNPA